MGDSITKRYGRLIRPMGGGGLESVEGAGGGEADLSDAGIRERVSATKAELYRIIKEHLGGSPDLYEIADKIASDGPDALKALGAGDERAFQDKPELEAGLEAIVRTDGSRPTFMVRKGEPDRTTSPLGDWGGYLDDSSDMLRDALACVGRIDAPGLRLGWEGTGFLIQRDLILTNRHVLQGIASQDGEGNWTLMDNATIDFGHEFRAGASISPRRLKSLVFCGSRPIVPTLIDHSKLDLALFELEPPADGQAPVKTLRIDAAPEWAQPEQTVYIAGYAGPPAPRAGYTPSLLEKLFQSTYGFKRLAPGVIMKSGVTSQEWTAAHDATTLGGNSGSVELVVGREHAAAGLHYGGQPGTGAENWAHVLASVLGETDGRSGPALREILNKRGVALDDRIVS